MSCLIRILVLKVLQMVLEVSFSIIGIERFVSLHSWAIKFCCTHDTVSGHCSPLKEVSPGKVLNGRLLSKPSTLHKSSPKSILSSPTKYRLDVPRRDKPLAAMVDSLASKFEKCSKIVPPKSVAPDDKVTFLRYPSVHLFPKFNYWSVSNDNVLF